MPQTKGYTKQNRLSHDNLLNFMRDKVFV